MIQRRTSQHRSKVRRVHPLAIAGLCLVAVQPAHCQQPSQAEIERFQQQFNSIQWVKGPTLSALGTVAQIHVPSGYQFTGPAGAAVWAELNQNPGNGELGVLVPDDLSFSLHFRYQDIGHVSDDEKLDANAILESIRAGTEAANVERRSRGWKELKIAGWIQPPAYDSAFNRLAWSIRDEDGGANYDTRLLGRSGVMSVKMVTDAARVNTLIPTVNGLLSNFTYTTGNTYAEWRQGDKVAAYGLTGLITGSAAVVTAKTGLLTKLGAFLAKGGKAIFIAIAAFFAAIWKAFAGKPKGGNAS